MTSLIMLLIGLAGQWLLGVAIAYPFLRGIPGRNRLTSSNSNVEHCSAAELAGLGLILGIGGTAGILFLWSQCGGMLGRGTSFVITIVGYVCGATSLALERRRTRSASPHAENPSTNDERFREQCWIRCCQFAVGCLFFVTLIQTLMTPQHLWDERASFALKGIVLWEDHTIFSRDLMDPNFVQFHPRYPFLIPLAELHIYELLGTVDDRLSKVIFPLLYLGMVLTIVGALQRHFTDGTAWLFGLLAATIPSLVPWEYGFPCGQADATTACYHGSSVVYLWIAWRQISSDHPAGWFRSAVFSGICGALAAFTKDEGIAYLMVDAIAMLLVTAISHRRPLAIGSFSTVFGVAAVLLTPWFLYRRELPLTTEANYFGRVSLAAILAGRVNLEWEVPHLTRRMFWEFRTWGLQWWLMAFGMLAAPRRALTAAQCLLLLDVAGSLASLMLAGMVAATEVSEHVGGSSHRYLMQIAPVAILFAAGQFGTLRSRT